MKREQRFPGFIGLGDAFSHPPLALGVTDHAPMETTLMKRLLSAVAICFVTVSASAAQAPVKTDAAVPEPSKLTISQCLQVLAGVRALDGFQIVVNEGKPNVQIVTRAYSFGNGALREDIARDISALTAVQKTSQESQQSIFKEIAKDQTEIKPGTPDFAEYAKQITDATAKPCDARLTRIKIKDLKLDVNEIPGSDLSNLDPILDR